MAVVNTASPPPPKPNGARPRKTVPSFRIRCACMCLPPLGGSAKTPRRPSRRGAVRMTRSFRIKVSVTTWETEDQPFYSRGNPPYCSFVSDVPDGLLEDWSPEAGDWRYRFLRQRLMSPRLCFPLASTHRGFRPMNAPKANKAAPKGRLNRTYRLRTPDSSLICATLSPPCGA